MQCAERSISSRYRTFEHVPISLLFSLFSIMAFAQGPWVILFSRYRGSCLISCPSVVFASAQSASGELSGLISTVLYCFRDGIALAKD